MRIGMGKLKSKTKTEMKRAFTTYYNVSSGEVGKKIGEAPAKAGGVAQQFCRCEAMPSP